MPMFKKIAAEYQRLKKIGVQFQCLNKSGRIPMLGRIRSE